MPNNPCQGDTKDFDFLNLSLNTSNLALSFLQLCYNWRVQIKIRRKDTWDMGNFRKKEWLDADFEHFGKVVDYQTDSYYFQAMSQEGKTIGVLICKVTAGVAYIDDLLVAKEYRKQGVGKLLVLKMEDFLKNEGVHKIYFYTGKNWEATKFYQRLGYKITAELPMHHFKQDFVQFSKLL